MNDRPRRPAPRTLVSSPLPSLRTPRASLYQARFPALATLLAGGAALPACHDVECGATRAEELESHGPNATRLAREGHAADAIREIGVALGLSGHAGRTRVTAPGESAVVTPQAPPVLPQPTNIPPAGGPMQVLPEPVQAPGQMPAATPHPAVGTRMGRRAAVQPAPATPPSRR